MDNQNKMIADYIQSEIDNFREELVQAMDASGKVYDLKGAAPPVGVAMDGNYLAICAACQHIWGDSINVLPAIVIVTAENTLMAGAEALQYVRYSPYANISIHSFLDLTVQYYDYGKQIIPFSMDDIQACFWNEIRRQLAKVPGWNGEVVFSAPRTELWMKLILKPYMEALGIKVSRFLRTAMACISQQITRESKTREILKGIALYRDGTYLESVAMEVEDDILEILDGECGLCSEISRETFVLNSIRAIVTDSFGVNTKISTFEKEIHKAAIGAWHLSAKLSGLSGLENLTTLQICGEDIKLSMMDQNNFTATLISKTDSIPCRRMIDIREEFDAQEPGDYDFKVSGKDWDFTDRKQLFVLVGKHKLSIPVQTSWLEDFENWLIECSVDLNHDFSLVIYNKLQNKKQTFWPILGMRGQIEFIT